MWNLGREKPTGGEDRDSADAGRGMSLIVDISWLLSRLGGEHSPTPPRSQNEQALKLTLKKKPCVHSGACRQHGENKPLDEKPCEGK